MDRELVVEKLKGHTYGMSPWQYAEAKQHVDPEFNYIVYENVYRFYRELKSPTYQLHTLMTLLAKTYTGIILEREKIGIGRSPVDINRIISVIFKAYDNYKGVKPESMFDIANFLPIYAICDILVQIRFYK